MIDPVQLRTLLNGDYFSFHLNDPSFERLKGGFRTHPDGDNGLWFPEDLSTLVYPISKPK